MAGDIQTQYPSTDTTALTITLASLATSSTLVVGRQSTVIDNTGNEDEDHLISGQITVGTSPTGGRIEIWAFAPLSVISGTRDYGLPGASDAAITYASRNQLLSGARLLWSTAVDTTSDREYYVQPTSLRNVFGELPTFWGVVVTHSSGVNLNSTAGNHFLHYLRIRKQYT